MKTKLYSAVFIFAAILVLSACAKDNDIKDSSAGAISEEAAGAEKKTESGVSYVDVVSKSVPENYPSDKLPLSQYEDDKILAVNTLEDKVFDFKVVTIRSYHEIIDEYAQMWELEGENVFYNDDIGAGNLMGTLGEYEIFVNASEESPDIPEGARTYCGILVRKKK